MRRILSIMVVAVLGMVILAACNSAEKKAPSAGPIASTPKAGTAPSDGIRRITVPELRDLLDKDEAVVIDVRDDASFKKAHIRGAKLIPVAEILNHTSELPKDKLIVTYCS